MYPQVAWGFPFHLLGVQKIFYDGRPPSRKWIIRTSRANSPDDPRDPARGDRHAHRGGEAAVGTGEGNGERHDPPIRRHHDHRTGRILPRETRPDEMAGPPGHLQG